MPETKISEQRKYERIEIPAAVAIYSGNVCRLVNISAEGLSFKSFLTIDFPEKWLLDIIIAGRNIQLMQIPVELVWKTATDQQKYIFIPAQSAGVKFDELHQSQEEMIEDFFYQL